MSGRNLRSSRARGTSNPPARSAQSQRNHSGTARELHARDTSRGRAHTRVLVEQVEVGRDVKEEPSGSSQAASGSSATGQCDNALDTLTVPETEVDEHSEASTSTSQQTDDDQLPGDDDSIAVDCHTNPSEVIVKGKNVKQIRVKFPPHPPKSEDGPRKKSGRSRLQRSASSSVRDSVTDNPPNDEKLPYPFEETSLPAIAETNNDNRKLPYVNLRRQESSISLHSYDAPYSQQLAASASAAGSGRYNSIDYDLKYKQDILAGLEYFEMKATDYTDLNNRLQQEVEVLKAKNRELEHLVDQLKNEKVIVGSEVDELKIQMDQSEKENNILREQAHSQWQERVAVEERFVELQRDSNTEINSLKVNIAELDRELHTLKLTKNIDNKIQAALDHTRLPGKKHGLSDDNFELMHTISRLQEDIRLLTREKDASADANARFQQEIENVKSSLKEKHQELESQYKRFISLKKSFNDLKEENDTLKSQSRGRGFPQHVGQREQLLANTTWPAGTSGPVPQRKNSINTVELESVSYIDLPKGTARPTNGGAPFKHAANVGHARPAKATKAATHKRTKSDVINLADNLPPVPNPSR